jgi:hypothetical protein
MIMLVQSAFLMALIVLTPPVIEALLRECRKLHLSHDNSMNRSSQSF